MAKMAWIVISLTLLTPLAFAKNRNPKDYPQKAKVLSFSRERGNPTLTHCNPVGTGLNCMGHARRYHILKVEIDGQEYTVSCFRCDPLIPGNTYPAKLNLKGMEILIIHQKDNGKWGQDNYSITSMEAPNTKK